MQKALNLLLACLSVLLISNGFIVSKADELNPKFKDLLNKYNQLSPEKRKLILNLSKLQNINCLPNHRFKSLSTNKRKLQPSSKKPQLTPRPRSGSRKLRPTPVVSPILKAQSIKNSSYKDWYGMDEQLFLPYSLSQMPFKYIKSKQQDNWSCGYNCLFNACNVENYFGRANSNSDLNNFSSICLKYLKQKGMHSDKGSSSKVLAKLAKDLNLHRLFFLENKRGNVVPLIYHWSYNKNITSKQAKLAAQKERLEDIKDHLKQNLGSKVFVHFICGIPDHWILISLMQKPNGDKSFYIFDNLNLQITQNSDVMAHIQYIYNNFNN